MNLENFAQANHGLELLLRAGLPLSSRSFRSTDTVSEPASMRKVPFLQSGCESFESISHVIEPHRLKSFFPTAPFFLSSARYHSYTSRVPSPSTTPSPLSFTYPHSPTRTPTRDGWNTLRPLPTASTHSRSSLIVPRTYQAPFVDNRRSPFPLPPLSTFTLSTRTDSERYFPSARSRSTMEWT